MEGVKQLNVIGGEESGFFTTKAADLLAWARKWSLFQYPFATACCGMEFMATASPAKRWFTSSSMPKYRCGGNAFLPEHYEISP